MLFPKPNHKRKTPKRSVRGSFNRQTRQLIFERERGRCQCCSGRAEQIHHVMPKSSGVGRGVPTNGMAICQTCHTKIHADKSMMTHWQNLFESHYGADYYKDAWDI